MRSLMFRIFLVSIGFIGPFSPSAWAQEPDDSTTIQLNKAVHFLAPNSSDVLVQPGRYTIESADHALRFIPEIGTSQLIGAEVSTHEEELDAPLAVSLPGQVAEFEDLHMVMLLLPGGQSLEAAGSYSGVRERALQLKKIANFKKRKRAKISRTAQRSRRRTAQRPPLSRAKAPEKGGLVAYRLSGLYILQNSTSQYKKAQKSDGKWIWPGEFDITPASIHIVWELGLPAAVIPKVIAKDGYGLELRLNGVLLKQKQSETTGEGDFFTKEYRNSNTNMPSLCPRTNTCLQTTILRRGWRSATAPWTVEVSYWKHGLKAEALGGSAIRLPGSDEPLVRPKSSQSPKTKIVGAIYPNQTAGQSYFTNIIYPIFKHERCTSCHALGSKSALVDRHHGLLDAGIIQEIPGRIGMNLGCGGGCHVYIPEATQPVPGVEFHDSEWKTPRFDIGIDWRGKSAKYICQKVTSSLPTAQIRNEHFFHDSRIAWAVHSGALPPPVGGKLSTAPPGDYYKFERLIGGWIWSGAPCPK